MGMVRRKLLVPEAKRLILPHARRFIPRSAPWIWVPKRFAPRMSVAIDSTGSETAFNTSATSFTYSGLTIGSSLTNSAAVWGAHFTSAAGGAASTFTATYNGVSVPFSLVLQPNNAAYTCGIFAVVNPTSGTHNFVLSTTTSGFAAIQGTSFTGVNQTGGTTSFAHGVSTDFSNVPGTSQSQAVTTANGNYTFAISESGGTATITFTPGNLYVDTTGQMNSLGSTPSGAQNASTTTSITYSLSQGSNDFFGFVGIDIVAAAGAATPDTAGMPIFRVQRPTWR